MLPKIYILRGRRSIKGPYTLVDFKKLTLQPGDKVWCKGLKDWELPDAIARLEFEVLQAQKNGLGPSLQYALG